MGEKWGKMGKNGKKKGLLRSFHSALSMKKILYTCRGMSSPVSKRTLVVTPTHRSGSPTHETSPSQSFDAQKEIARKKRRREPHGAMWQRLTSIEFKLDWAHLQWCIEKMLKIKHRANIHGWIVEKFTVRRSLLTFSEKGHCKNELPSSAAKICQKITRKFNYRRI